MHTDHGSHLVHVGVYQDLKGSHGQGDVGGGCGDGQHVVERLLPHVVGVDGLQQVPAGHGHHGGVHGELQLPGAQLRVGVHTGEPEPVGGARIRSRTMRSGLDTQILSGRSSTHSNTTLNIEQVRLVSLTLHRPGTVLH